MPNSNRPADHGQRQLPSVKPTDPSSKPKPRPRHLPCKALDLGPLFRDRLDKDLPATDRRGNPFPRISRAVMPIDMILPRLQGVSGS